MKTLLILCIVVLPFIVRSQALLQADGPGNTYELINSVLSPGSTAVEAPDQCTSHPAFGRHIAEVFDTDLNQYVFEFYIHVTPDNDRCISFDRQRVEIKTYEPSPDNLKGTIGETITYKWRFKVPVGYQPSSSFSHIHQIKAVGGDDDDPLFTLTARKGTPNKLELIYVQSSSSSTNKVAIVNLSLFEGTWVEATEVVKVGANGTYSMTIKKVSDGTTILSYSNANIATIRPDNDFIRPKWGIYRSLNTPADLRDEALRFNSFSITEGAINSNTYYWTGGVTTKSMDDNANWNTALDGSGTTRLLVGAGTTDILVFDGSNIGGSTPTTGTAIVTVPTTIGIAQLKLQNNVAVVMQRPTSGGGTGALTIAGDGTTAPDLNVDAGCSLTINSPNADGAVNIGLSSGATGAISGTVTIANTGTHRITSQTINGLVFANGSTFNSNGIPTSAAYPFGNNSQGAQNGIVFQQGANLVVNGNKSPMGNISTFQACNMLPGSNFYVRTSNVASSGAWSNLKTFGNIYIQNGANFTCDGPFYKIENLTIDNACALVTHTSGNTPILGNLLVNGNLSAPVGSTNLIVMGGSDAQTISGTGTINVPSLTVANYSNIVLSKSISVNTGCNILGQLDFGTVGQINGNGSFTSRTGSTAATVTGNTIAGSYLVTGVVGTLSGNAGLAISGTGLDMATNAVGFSSSNAVINLSKPALATTTGSSFSFGSDSATLVTANPNGMDSINGSVTVVGNKTFQQGTNYHINGNNSWPFGINTIATSSMVLGKVVIDGFVTSNYNIYIRGGLYVNSGNFTLRASDTIRVSAMGTGRYFNQSLCFSRQTFATHTSQTKLAEHRSKHSLLGFDKPSLTNQKQTIILDPNIPILKPSTPRGTPLREERGRG